MPRRSKRNQSSEPLAKNEELAAKKSKISTQKAKSTRKEKKAAQAEAKAPPPAEQSESENEESQHEDEVHVSDLSEDSDASEFEEPRALRSRNQTPKASAKKEAKKSSTQRKIRRKPKADDGELLLDETDGNELFQSLQRGEKHFRPAIRKWVVAFRDDSAAAVADLLSFFVHASDGTGTVTPSMIGDLKEAVSELEDSIRDREQYPLIGKFRRTFKKRLLQFVDVFVEEAADAVFFVEIVAADSMMESGTAMSIICNFLTSMSTSHFRPFRHTATTIIMHVGSCLARIAVDKLSEAQKARSLRAAKTSKSPKRSKKAQAQADQDRLETAMQHYDDLTSLVEGLSQGVFVHRFRDTVADIRQDVIQEYGVWAQLLPQSFCEWAQFKYIGWAYKDKSAAVRLAALEASIPIYKASKQPVDTTTEDEDTRREANTRHADNMQTCISGFLPRILMMVLEKDEAVALKAFECLHVLYDLDYLEDDETAWLWHGVYSDSEKVAVKAGEFLAKSLVDKDLPEQFAHHSIDDEDTQAKLVIKTLVRFVERHFESEGKMPLLVEAIAMHVPAVTDWDNILVLLQQTNEEAEDEDQADAADTHLTPSEELELIKFLIAAADAADEADKLAMTKKFLPVLPELLRKFMPDETKVCLMCKLPQFFDLDEYTSSSADSLTSLKTTLGLLNEAILKATLPENIDECFETLQFLKASETSITSYADKLEEHINEGIDEVNEDGDMLEKTFNAMITMRRLTSFARQFSLADYTLYKPLRRLYGLVDCEKQHPEFVEELLKLSLFVLAFRMKTIVDGDETGEVGSLLDDIAKMRDIALATLRSSDVDAGLAALNALSELAILSANRESRLEDGKHDDMLVLHMSDAVAETMIQFIVTYLQSPAMLPAADPDTDEPLQVDQERVKAAVAPFVRLVNCHLVDVRDIGPLLPFYHKFPVLAELVKQALKTIRSQEADKLSAPRVNDEDESKDTRDIYALTIASALFEWYRTSPDAVEEIRSVAKQLSRTFIQARKDTSMRTSLIWLHLWCFKVALKPGDDEDGDVPPNIGFLEVLRDFSSQLAIVDRKFVGGKLDEEVRNYDLSPSPAKAWAALDEMSAFLAGAINAKTPKSGRKLAAKTTSTRGRRGTKSSARKAGSSRKRHVPTEDISDSEDEGTFAGSGSKKGFTWGKLQPNQLSSDSEAESPAKKPKQSRESIEELSSSPASSPKVTKSRKVVHALKLDFDDVDEELDSGDDLAPAF